MTISPFWTNTDLYYQVRRRLPADPPAEPPPATYLEAIRAWVNAQTGVFTVADLRAAVGLPKAYNSTIALRRVDAVRVGFGKWRRGGG